jgi:hypothetical protein
MVRAVLRDGLFHPLDPIPADWVPGQQLRVEEIDPDSAVQSEDIDQWLRDLEDATAKLDDAQEWAVIELNLAEADQLAGDFAAGTKTREITKTNFTPKHPALRSPATA